MHSDNLPDEHGCLALLRKYETPAHIIDHSVKVWHVAQVLGEALREDGHPIDMDLLKTACLLHDIAKYLCIREGLARHDRKGEEILRDEDLPQVGVIVGQHVILRDSEGDPIREEHLLYYADKRVVHDEVVDLDRRFQYLIERYGTFPQAEEKLQIMKRMTQALEDRLFQHVDFTPEELEDLIG